MSVPMMCPVNQLLSILSTSAPNKVLPVSRRSFGAACFRTALAIHEALMDNFGQTLSGICLKTHHMLEFEANAYVFSGLVVVVAGHEG